MASEPSAIAGAGGKPVVQWENPRRADVQRPTGRYNPPMKSVIAIAPLLASLTFSTILQAQAPAAPPPQGARGGAPAPLAVPNPTYVSIPMEITVDRPAAEMWKRVGSRDIGEWLRVMHVSGKDGEIGGAIGGQRSARRQTELSHTYLRKPVRGDAHAPSITAR